jgi:hypothetical protein
MLKSSPQSSKVEQEKNLMRLNFYRITVALSIIVLIVLSLGLFITYRQWDFDDAYIVYRIVRNIINGHGWVYNLGESHNPSTSVLNTLLITAFSYLTGDIRLSAHIIGTLAVLTAGLIAFKLFRDKFGNSIGVLTAYLLIRKLGNNLTWGLECNLFIAFLMLFVFLEEYHKNSWPLLGVLVLTRPDGILMVGLKWLKEFISRRQYSVRGLFIVLIILMPWLIFSIHQFHHFSPDTFSQKIWQGYSGFWGSSPVYLTVLVHYYVKSSGLLLKSSMVLSVIGMLCLILDRSCFLYIILFVLLQQLAYIIFNVPMYYWYRALPDFLIVVSALYAIGTFLKSIQNRYEHRFASFAQRFLFLTQFRKELSLSVPLLMLIPAVLTIRSGYKNPKVDQRDIAYTQVIKQIDSQYGEGNLAAIEVGSIGFNTDRTIVDICGLTSAKGQFLTPARMGIFYSEPPALLLLHSPIWGHEAAIYNDYRFPIVYKLENCFSDIHFPMQLYVRKEKFDFKNLETQLSEAYRSYQSYQQDERFGPDTLKLLSNGIVILDIINEEITTRKQLVMHKRPVLFLQGWAVDIQRHQVPADVLILLINENGRIYSLSAKRYKREDIAKNLNDPEYNMSGFQAVGLTQSLPSGIYKIQIVQEIEGSYYYVEVKNRIHIPEQNHFIDTSND